MFYKLPMHALAVQLGDHARVYFAYKMPVFCGQLNISTALLGLIKCSRFPHDTAHNRISVENFVSGRPRLQISHETYTSFNLLDYIDNFFWHSLRYLLPLFSKIKKFTSKLRQGIKAFGKDISYQGEASYGC